MSKKDHKFFLNKIKPYPFCDDGNKNVYIKIINVPMFDKDFLKDINQEEKGDEIVHISLINEDMLNYDELFFQGENKKAYYRPYFYEFYAFSRDIDEKILTFLKINQGRWMRGKFNNEKQSNENEYSIFGDVFFSASPFQVKSRFLIITDEEAPDEIKTKILKTYDTSYARVRPGSTKHREMRRFLRNIVKSNDFFTRIFNVGQGNCIYIKTSENKRILFDIGYNKNPNSSDWYDYYIIKSKRSIMRLKPHLNILSHWDMDHIIGVTFAQKNMFEHPWIGPNLNELSNLTVSAARLAKYLDWKNQLFLVDDKFLGRLVYCGPSFRLWRGEGHSYSLSKANNFGLIIELLGKKRMLLPGDCEYRMLPSRLRFSFNRYNYLIVPHHCSAMKLLALSPKSDDIDYAIISAGDNSYKPKHPADEHIIHLRNGNYNIVQTVGNWCVDIPSVNSAKIYNRIR